MPDEPISRAWLIEPVAPEDGRGLEEMLADEDFVGLVVEGVDD